MRLTLFVLGALVAGLVAGSLVAATDDPILRGIAAWIEPLGRMWVNAIRMTVVPLVFSILVGAVAARQDARAVGRLGYQAVVLFVLFLFAGGLFALAAAPPLLRGMDIDPETAAALRSSVEDPEQLERDISELPSVRDRIVSIVPTNVVAAAAEGAMLPVVFFALVLGLAAGRLPSESRDRLIGLFQALGEAMLVVVKWVLELAPIGVFALALDLASEMGFAAAGAIARYVLVLSGLMAAFIVAIYPAVYLLSRIAPGRFAPAYAPAQAVGASTRSSLAALPAMLAAAREKLDLDPKAAGFVLPLAVSIFRVNVPIAWMVGAVFLGQLYGVSLSLAALLYLLVTSVAISFSVPGLPSASLYLLAPVLAEIGLPPEGVGVLIAVDVFPDVFKTTANVTSHLAVATLLARRKPGSA